MVTNTARRPNVALMLLTAVLFCASGPSGGRCDDADCDYAESYDQVVAVNVTEPVTVTKYKWCLDIPPRCLDSRQEYRTVRKNVTISKMRTVRRCCKDQIQLYDSCVPKCAEDQCPNVQCAPGTDKCKCKPGYTGHLCRQKCDVGRWGLGCRTACHRSCSDCDHGTGCCKTPLMVGDRSGLILCAAVPTAARQTSDGSAAGRFGDARSSQPAADTTLKPASTVTTAAGGSVEAKIENPGAAVETPVKRRTDSNEFVRTVTKMEVTVYKYDELVKKLVWISAMTVVAIALVFVIMFVVFFNCYGVPKVQVAAAAIGRRTSTAVTVGSDKMHETCISAQNLGHIPQDRYTKCPAQRTPSINVDLPIHPEIFCPVFSAPHFPGSALYDSPQPLYEILC